MKLFLVVKAMGHSYRGAIYRCERKLFTDVRDYGWVVTADALAEYWVSRARIGMDNHIMVCGQNGVGKSYTALNLTHKIIELENSFKFEWDNVFFPHQRKQELSKTILEKEDNIFILDEIKKFLHYQEWNTREQRELVNSVEYARFRRNIIIGCTREPERVDNNYRDGKVNDIIYLIDRPDYGPAFGFVLHSNSYIQMADKWKLEEMSYARNPTEIFEAAESTGMFLGYWFGDHKLRFDSQDYERVKDEKVKEYARQLFETPTKENKRKKAEELNKSLF